MSVVLFKKKASTRPSCALRLVAFVLLLLAVMTGGLGHAQEGKFKYARCQFVVTVNVNTDEKMWLDIVGEVFGDGPGDTIKVDFAKEFERLGLTEKGVPSMQTINENRCLYQSTGP